MSAKQQKSRQGQAQPERPSPPSRNPWVPALVVIVAFAIAAAVVWRNSASGIASMEESYRSEFAAKLAGLRDVHKAQLESDRKVMQDAYVKQYSVGLAELRDAYQATIPTMINETMGTRITNAERDTFANAMTLAELDVRLAACRRLAGEGLCIEEPLDHCVIQRQDGKADIPYRIVTAAGTGEVEVRLVDKSTGAAFWQGNARQGTIPAVPVGDYDLKASAGSRSTAVRVSVGDVFLVAGQSNAVSPAQRHPRHFSETGRVTIGRLWNLPPGAGSLFTLPTSQSPLGDNVCWIYCGDMIVKDYGVPVAFINIAVGGTSTDLWKPEADYLCRGFNVLRRHKVRAVLWHQGEADFLKKLPAKTSQSNMQKLIAWTQALQPGLEWVVAVNSHKSARTSESGEPGEPDIRKAQLAVIEAGLARRGPDTDELRDKEDWVESGGAEFVGPALKAHGEMWFATLKDLYYAAQPATQGTR